jgi:hypothetical protein
MILVIGRIAGQGRVRHLENGVTHRFGYRIVDRISNRLGRIDERPVFGPRVARRPRGS